MSADYLRFIVGVRQHVTDHPGISRSELHQWAKSAFRWSSMRIVSYIDKMVEDDYLRVITNVEDGGKPRGRGRPKRRYVVSR